MGGLLSENLIRAILGLEYSINANIGLKLFKRDECGMLGPAGIYCKKRRVSSGVFGSRDHSSYWQSVFQPHT